MATDLRLVVFDVDGTLVDSQADIVASMTAAFDGLGVAVPARADILSIVGLSLPQAMARLAPDADGDGLVRAYKAAYVERRAAAGARASSPLYPGARDALERLQAEPNILLGIATGKSRRGLDLLLDAYDLRPYFVTQQVADFHPSKPHPAMLHAAMNEAGVEADQAVMIGDTTFDMDMAGAAGMAFVGVSWGYHPAAHLTEAAAVLDDFDGLDPALAQLWER
ncbi:HAD-IA family hydrolase [uncultured Tateyamaria sp.]|uniref:HAD-IA family hydrolase n=1 Tax=uncultured Tateyamaria sp. TaxID=455651 RepID=UPI0026206A06|nr:HAD-IA family hydrolase [uncultured Tateyamaria sp.]